MNWLTDNKIPIDDVAETVFEWLQANGGWFFDGLAAAMERLIDAILWVLQTPHPLIIIAAFAGLTWAIQRNWKTVALVVIGFFFILNQDYWEETTESLTLVLSACVVCMGVGVPIGIAAAHRPRLYRLWGQTQPDVVENRTALCLAADHDGAEPNDHVVAQHGGDRSPCGGRWSGRAGGARVEPGQHRAGL